MSRYVNCSPAIGPHSSLKPATCRFRDATNTVAAGKCFGPLPVEGKGGVHHDNSVRNNYFYDTSATAEGMPHLRPRADGRAQQNPRCGHLREVRLSDSAEAKSGLTGALVSPRTDQEHCS